MVNPTLTNVVNRCIAEGSPVIVEQRAAPSVTAQLEAMIDAHGLLHVLTGLECICSEKADHLRANWQDKLTARRWDKAATACGRAARADGVIAVS